jgi:hypothetical protein
MMRWRARKAAPPGLPPAGAPHPSRLGFELALGLAVGGRRSWKDVVRSAAQACGGDIVFALPVSDESGRLTEQAVVRVTEDGNPRFAAVRPIPNGGVSVSSELEIDPALIALARSCADVLERLEADAAFVEALPRR